MKQTLVATPWTRKWNVSRAQASGECTHTTSCIVYTYVSNGAIFIIVCQLSCCECHTVGMSPRIVGARGSSGEVLVWA